MSASTLVRCFDCGTEIPLDQTVEMEWHGPETIPNPKRVAALIPDLPALRNRAL